MTNVNETNRKPDAQFGDTTHDSVNTDGITANQSLTDAAGVTHTGELADIDDLGSGGGSGAAQSTATFSVRRTDADEYEVRDSSGSVVFTETNVSNGHNAIAYAVDNLPAGGGRVVLGEGQFNIIDNKINLTSNDTLTGQGRSTVLRFNDGISLANPSGAITITGTSSNPVVDAEVSHLAVDGNKANVSAGHLDAELINVAEAEEISIHHTYGFDGINEHIDLDSTTNSAFYNNYAENCDGWGIHNSTDSGQNRIVYNYVANCGVANARGGIDQFKGSNGSCVLVGNIAVNNYRNYEIESSGAISTGNKSISGNNADVWTGVESAGDSGSAGGGGGGGGSGTLTTGDVVSASGDGSTNTFTLLHSHGQVPKSVSVDPASADANSPFYVSAKTTSTVDVTFTTPPASGTDNLTFEIVSVGDGGGGTTSVIEDFEDGDVNEYTGATGAFSATSGGAFNGNNKLEIGSATSTNNAIESTTGLDSYPQQGDTFRIALYNADTADAQQRFYWFTGGNFTSDDEGDAYGVQVTPRGINELNLFRFDGGSQTSLDVASYTMPDATWIEVEVSHDSDGNISADVIENGSVEASVSATDTTYTGGGVGYRMVGSTSGAGTLRWDYYRKV